MESGGEGLPSAPHGEAEMGRARGGRLSALVTAAPLTPAAVIVVRAPRLGAARGWTPDRLFLQVLLLGVR